VTSSHGLHVSIFVEVDAAPVWSGNLPAPPTVGDHVWVWVERERKKRHFVVSRRDWSLYGAAAAIQVYMEPVL
jgi:hypothetical protein